MGFRDSVVPAHNIAARPFISTTLTSLQSKSCHWLARTCCHTLTRTYHQIWPSYVPGVLHSNWRLTCEDHWTRAQLVGLKIRNSTELKVNDTLRGLCDITFWQSLTRGHWSETSAHQLNDASGNYVYCVIQKFLQSVTFIKVKLNLVMWIFVSEKTTRAKIKAVPHTLWGAIHPINFKVFITPADLIYFRSIASNSYYFRKTLADLNIVSSRYVLPRHASIVPISIKYLMVCI